MHEEGLCGTREQLFQPRGRWCRQCLRGDRVQPPDEPGAGGCGISAHAASGGGQPCPARVGVGVPWCKRGRGEARPRGGLSAPAQPFSFQQPDASERRPQGLTQQRDDAPGPSGGVHRSRRARPPVLPSVSHARPSQLQKKCGFSLHFLVDAAPTPWTPRSGCV